MEDVDLGVCRGHDIAAGFEQLSVPALLVGGTADESWDGELARGAGHDVLELAGVDHSLQIEGDPLASVEALRVVTGRIDEFVSGIEG